MDELTDQELAHIRNKDMGFRFSIIQSAFSLSVYTNVEIPLLYSDVSP